MELKNYDKEERFDPATVEALKGHYTEILRLLGEDPAREGLLKTPERVAKAMSFLTKGYDENPLEIIRSATFREEYKQMVLVKDIELYSMCEHHMLPFYGKAHVAYIPNGRITGLSKIARVVECFARRLQVQERLTVQIRDCIQEALNPMGGAAGTLRRGNDKTHHLLAHRKIIYFCRGSRIKVHLAQIAREIVRYCPVHPPSLLVHRTIRHIYGNLSCHTDFCNRSVSLVDLA